MKKITDKNIFNYLSEYSKDWEDMIALYGVLVLLNTVGEEGLRQTIEKHYGHIDSYTNRLIRRGMALLPNVQAYFDQKQKGR